MLAQAVFILFLDIFFVVFFFETDDIKAAIATYKDTIPDYPSYHQSVENYARKLFKYILKWKETKKKEKEEKDKGTENEKQNEKEKEKNNQHPNDNSNSNDHVTTSVNGSEIDE